MDGHPAELANRLRHEHVHRQFLSGATRASSMLEFAMASNAPKRSDSISSGRVGEASR